MGDDITIGVTEIVNNIEVTAQPNDQVVEIDVIDNTDEVTLNITPTVIEINVNKGSSFARWGTIFGTLSDQEDLQDALDLKADLVDGKVPASQLPSYVDDIIEVANFAALPTVGETGKIYVTLDNNKIYRWSGSVYIEIAANNAIWGSITGTLSNQTDLQNALNLRVPYTGATSNVNLGEYGLSSGFLGLDTTPTNTPTSLGTLYWDSFYRTASLVDGVGNTTLQVGQEERLLVHNNTGSTLTNGQVVYITGSTGELPSVSLANASNENTSAATLGVITENIANGTNGFVTVSGIVHGLNTLAYNEGDILWLGTTAGTFTTTKPISPNHLVLIGYVVKKSGGNGSILVKIQNTQELEESSDVLFTSLANNNFLVYESSTDLWKNKSLGTVLGGTSSQFVKGDGSLDSTAYVPTSRTLTINGSTQDLSANRTFNIDVGVTSFNTRTGAVTLSSSDVTTALGYTPVTQARTLTIHGTTFDLSANRSWTIPAASWGSITGTLSNQTDLQSALDDRPTGNGTINYITKFTATRSVGLSQIYDDGTNVGIGTTLPAVKLDVNGNVNIGNISNTTNNFFRIQTNKAVFSIQANGSTNAAGTTINYTWHDGGQGPLIFNRALGVETMRLDANGNVGIGTTSPAIRLFGVSTSDTYVAGFQGAGGTNFIALGTVAGNVPAINGFTANFGTVANITLQSNGGNVGIGTTSPEALMHISSQSTTSLILNNANTNDRGTNIIFKSQGANTSFIGTSGSILADTTKDLTLWATDNNGIRFYSNGFNERMRITSAGNVGIGTTTPSSLLHINGSGYFPAKLITLSGAEPTRYSANIGTLIVDGSKIGLALGTRSDNVNYDNSLVVVNGNVGIGTTDVDSRFKAELINVASLRVAFNGTSVNYYDANENIFRNGAGTERMRITSGGNVGIGTTSPTERLTVSNGKLALTTDDVTIGGKIYGYNDTSVNLFSGGLKFETRFFNGSAYVYRDVMTINGSGNVGIGTTSPSYTLHVNGSVAGTSAYVNLSDKRYKKDILPIENALDKILALNGITFNWDKENTDMNLDDNNHIGLLAQDVEEIIPQVVSTGTDENKTKSVAYTDLIPVLIEAIKELQQQINDLKNK